MIALLLNTVKTGINLCSLRLSLGVSSYSILRNERNHIISLYDDCNVLIWFGYLVFLDYIFWYPLIGNEKKGEKRQGSQVYKGIISEREIRAWIPWIPWEPFLDCLKKIFIFDFKKSFVQREKAS